MEEKIMLSVYTNVASLNAQNSLSKSQGMLNTSLARLSSGLRINSAKDDAAGLAISNRMTSQIRGLNQAARNANDGISLAQTAEGALDEVTNMLQRMRELAIQAANGTYSDSDRASLNAEYLQLMDEVDRVALNTKFNDQPVLDGTLDEISFQVGSTSSETDTIVVDFDEASVTINGLDIDGTEVGSAEDATDAIGALDDALTIVNSFRGTLGAIQSRFESTIANVMNITENVSAARSRIMDADFAMETANLTRAQILQQAGVSMLAQANMVPQTALTLLS